MTKLSKTKTAPTRSVSADDAPALALLRALDGPEVGRSLSEARSLGSSLRELSLSFPRLRTVHRDISVATLTEEVEETRKGTAEAFDLPVGSVVRLFVTGVPPSYTSPWRVNDQEEWEGSGFCISGRRIVTNAHCVSNSTVLQVQRQGHPRKWLGRAAHIAHDIDLAIIEVDDEVFWSDAIVAELGPDSLEVELYSEVNAIGFPTGGSTLCVTKGVISRFDAQLYVHPEHEGIRDDTKNNPGPVFLLQVDSALNSGSSGGPAVDKRGRVIGVASSGRDDGQNIGYVIPASIVHLFLNEVEGIGRWTGVSELGFTYRELESDCYREFLDMDDELTGVLIDEIAPLGSVNGVLLPGDVLTHIDSRSVSNEGKVAIAMSNQEVYIDIVALITCKPKGRQTQFRVIRKCADGVSDGDSQTVEMSVKLTPLPPLAPRFHGFDVLPEYVLLGGFVFSRASAPLFDQAESLEYFGSFQTAIRCLDTYKRDEMHEAVILVKTLRHDINVGYEFDLEEIEKVNGVDIQNLKHLASVAKALEGEALPEDSGTGDFVRIYLKKKVPSLALLKMEPDLPDIVLRRSKIALANREICNDHDISHIISPSLL